MLEASGMPRVWVVDLEDDETGEDDAVLHIAREMACGSCEIRLAPGGRANVFATESSCTIVDTDVLKEINTSSCVNAATARSFSFAQAGQRIATVKSAPFAVSAAHLDTLLFILKDRGPILQARPIRKPTIAVLYSDLCDALHARQLFENILAQRLRRFGAVANIVLSSLEEENAIARNLQQLLEFHPTCVVIASTTAPAGPDDAIGRAMDQVECSIVRFLAPVEPGNLLLLGYRNEIPIVSAPGCFRSAKPNILDLILPPMLSRYRISDWEIASLGHGGLLV